MADIVFWQKIISPHMACLARELAVLGHKVCYVAEKRISSEREKMGWTPPEISGVELRLIEKGNTVNQILGECSDQTVHLLQGLRGNGYIKQVAMELQLSNARWGVVMETIKEPLFRGFIKRHIYRRLLHDRSPDFVLAIGEKTPPWVAARGYPVAQIFPFTYFLENRAPESTVDNCYTEANLRVGYVGQLIPRKRIDLLLNALAGMSGIELFVIGDGPLKSRLEGLAEQKIKQIETHWLGQMPMDKARQTIAMLDCLVLPSNHDGWGAVVTEALMSGTPAICSDHCGAAAAVLASGVGGVFPRGDGDALRLLLIKMQQMGKLTTVDRQKLAEWGQCFSSATGAEYLTFILHNVYQQVDRPLPPWQLSSPAIDLNVNLEPCKGM